MTNMMTKSNFGEVGVYFIIERGEGRNQKTGFQALHIALLSTKERASQPERNIRDPGKFDLLAGSQRALVS